MPLMVLAANGRPVVLGDDVVQQLAASLRGSILTSDSREYDGARAVWNAMIDRRPALIVRCASAADVVRAVRFAAEHELQLSVRGGGHNIAGSAVREGALMIDLSPMRSVRVDLRTRTAHVGGGAILGDVDREAQTFGLATSLGINSTTGVAGLTLGGGFGWLSRRFGMTIDNLVSADVVTADGRLRHASPGHEPDLFWAVRGGGGNFGVVTSFELALHALGPTVLAGFLVYPFNAAQEVLRFCRAFLPGTPEELMCFFVLRRAPPFPFLPTDWHGKEIVALALCYSGDVDEGARLLAPLRAFGKPVADVIAPRPFVAWQQILDPGQAPGARNYWKSHNLRELSDELIGVLVEQARRIPDPESQIIMGPLDGAQSRVPPDATAYCARAAQYVMNVQARWRDPARDRACIAWAREVFEASAPFSTGDVYVNFLTEDETERVRAAYGSNYERLVELKGRYDPGNLFQANMNIRPAVQVEELQGI